MLMADPGLLQTGHEANLDGHWLRTVQVPTARAFARGYDRVVTDGLLAECADVLEELELSLRFAHDQIETLRRQQLTRAGRRARSRVRRTISARTHRRRRSLRSR
jgi:hypothetical protein